MIDETTPQNSRGKKGVIRIELERRLAEAAPDVPSLVVRAGDRSLCYRRNGCDVRGIDWSRAREGRLFPLVVIQEAGLDGFWIGQALGG